MNPDSEKALRHEISKDRSILARAYLCNKGVIRDMARTDEEILECYAQVLSKLKDILQEDIMVLITDRTHRLHYYPGNKLAVDLRKLGDSLSAEDKKTVAMEKGETISYVIDKKVFGVPFRSIDYPIRNEQGKVIGCAGIGRSLEKEHYIEGISQNLASTLEQVNAGLEEVVAGSQDLSNSIHDVAQSANESARNIQQINKAISSITEIANLSNLLGLNAAIEAARAGEHGRGFAVVADEMRKLAVQSKDSAKMVTVILTQMKISIERIIADINGINSIAQNQAVATEEITAAIQEVSGSSQLLANAAKIG